MKSRWPADELTEHWSLSADEKQLVQHKREPLRLGFAALLKFFQHEGRFPKPTREVPKAVIAYLGQQLDLPPTGWNDYDWGGRTIKYHRAKIRAGALLRAAELAAAGRGFYYAAATRTHPGTDRPGSLDARQYRGEDSQEKRRLDQSLASS